MINKKIILSFVASVLLSTSLSAIDNKVYASVNGKDITLTDIQVAIKDPRINFDKLPKEQQKRILEQLVQKNILASKAMHSDIVNDEVYKKTLKTTIANIKEELALQVWMQKLSKEIKVSEKDMKDFYDKNKDKFVQKAQYKASHILLKTENEAKDIIKTLKKSKNLKEDFASLAKEKSTGPSSSNGGDLGWFSLDKMVPEFSQSLSLMKVNTTSATPVKTQFGFHVIYLSDMKKATTVSYDKAKDQIKMILSQNKFKEKLDGIIKEEMKKAKITYK